MEASGDVGGGEVDVTVGGGGTGVGVDEAWACNKLGGERKWWKREK